MLYSVIKNGAIIYAFYSCIKEENHISLYTAPNDLKLLWGVVYAMSSLYFKFHQFWILYDEVYVFILFAWMDLVWIFILMFEDLRKI
jgi:hypothetical protein